MRERAFLFLDALPDDGGDDDAGVVVPRPFPFDRSIPFSALDPRSPPATRLAGTPSGI